MTPLRLGSTGPEVEELHAQLDALGFPTWPTVRAVRGVFDALTEAHVREFQARADLDDDGEVGDLTRAALLADVRALGTLALRDFRGSVAFTLTWEGHAGRPYWPRGASGVTLDPGFDLGQRDTSDALRELYADTLTAADFDALELAIGVRGALARELVHDPFISRVRIGRLDAARVLPRIAAGYWRSAVEILPSLGRQHSSPSSAHTALLSLTYNAGPGALAGLRAPAAVGNWALVAARVRAMNATSESLSRRRRAEAALIDPGA